MPANPALGKIIQGADTSRGPIFSTKDPRFVWDDEGKLDILRDYGYAVGEKWDKRAKLAWKNLRNAVVLKKDPRKAASFWSRNSKLSTAYEPPKKTPPPAAPPPDGDTAPVTTVSNPYLDALNTGQQLSAGALQQLSEMFGGLTPPKGVQIDPRLANRGLTPYGPELLDAASGKGVYDSAIKTLQQSIRTAQDDTAANVKQIEGWYGQVGQSLAKAAERDKAIQAASLGSVTESARAIASAIGGEANPGASMAAQAGAQGAGLVSAMGAANDEFNSDIAPLLQAEGVGRMAQERSAGSKRAQELAIQLAQTRAEQAGAQGDARLKLAQLNNELSQQGAKNLIDIMQANAGSRQQDFQNRTGLFGLASGLASLGIDAFKSFMPDTPKTTKPRTPTPASASSLRQSDLAAIGDIEALRQLGQLNPQTGVQAVKAAYGITSATPKAARQAAFRTAQRAMPSVKIDPRWFGL